MQHDTLLVVDIETVPDRKHHEGESFPRPPFHKVVAIGFLRAEIKREADGERYVLKELRCGGETTSSEAELLAGFFQYFERLRPRLVTFNGRSFDIPVLKYRAMLHGVAAPLLHNTDDRFNNYTYRYNSDWHCDLLEVLTDYRASTAVKLDDVASLFGFPGKMGIDGSQIEGMYEVGELVKIRNYCETDVLNTYLVYLRYNLHRATLSKENYNQAIADVVSFIEAEGQSRTHLKEFVDAWSEASDGEVQLK